jgi:hypothetical protein
MLEVFNGSSWISAQAQVTDQVIIGDGVTPTYSLTQSSLAGNMMVMINGVVQIPFTSYITSGNIITFAEAPLPSDTVDIRFIAQSITSNSNVPTTSVVDSTPIDIQTYPTIIDTFSIFAYSSAKYTISIKFADNNVQLTEIFVAQNSSDSVVVHEVATSGVTGLSVYSLMYNASLLSNNCIIYLTSPTAIASVKVQKTYFTV